MRNYVLIISAITCSCTNPPEEKSTISTPPDFVKDGYIQIERASYGGAAGGYRHIVDFVDSQGKRSNLFNDRSNRLAHVKLMEPNIVQVNFCSDESDRSPLVKVGNIDGIVVERLC
jgi:hypothetical protein